VGNLDIQVKIGRFVGYDDESKGYRIYWPEKRSVTIEREVRFNPDKLLIPDDLLGNKGEWPTFGDSNVYQSSHQSTQTFCRTLLEQQCTT